MDWDKEGENVIYLRFFLLKENAKTKGKGRKYLYKITVRII